jgi:nuclear respiratory factor 1
MSSVLQMPHYISGVVQTISNPDGTVSIVHVDPNNPVITLPDGTQAQVKQHILYIGN